ncbi:MAG: hypothetical protein LBJ90_07130 [Treponema sp.]|jgi:hypothetical protein|nr:hypothetical protein [Treponema sp.]
MRCEYRTLRNFGLLAAAAFFFTAGAGAQTQRALLFRGNEWRTGLPGFGDNVFSSFFGEYRIEASSAENDPSREQAASAESGVSGSSEAEPSGAFSVRVSGEALVFAPGLWQSRAGIASALQRGESGSLFVAVPFAGAAVSGSWTILFQFPSDLGQAGLDETSANRLMNAWITRFRYFFSLIKTASDISLPAVVNF